MNFKSSLIAVASVLALGAAQADTTVDAGLLVPGDVFENTFINAAGSFLDVINFTINQPVVVNGSANNLPLTLKLKNVLDIAPGATVTLWNNHAHQGSQVLATWSLDNVTTTFNLAPSQGWWPHAGAFHIDIAGQATGLKGGRYSVALEVTPVPEPETYALMLAGLGAVGFVARRRKAA